MDHKLEHPLLGKLISKPGASVNQYLGLKYAALENRFAEAKLYCPQSQSDTIDATDFGPSVATAPNGCDMEYSFIQKSLNSPVFTYSELEGLNLNITVPCNVSHGKKFPVFVFLHGGGLAIGSNSWPQYDLAKFVQISIEEKQPVIGININYRTGIFGFLTSEELRGAGFLGNNGLRDQKIAFEWIRKNISGFGGDTENITVCGQSAGGVLATLHLYSQQPEFDRAIIMGGTALLLKPLPPFIHEGLYKSIIEALGLESLTPEQRISALMTLPVDEMISKIPAGHPWNPLIDEEVIPNDISFKSIAGSQSLNVLGKKWLKSLCIGSNSFDASIMVGALQHRSNLAHAFITSINNSLSTQPHLANAILKTYGISQSLSEESIIMAILTFINDIAFHAPTITYARGWGSKSYMYSFREGNPWEGRFKGHATHILDVVFLFQNFNQFLDPLQAQSARAFAIDIIRFINGDEPWPPYSENAAARIYGPSDGTSSPISTEASISDEGQHSVEAYLISLRIQTWMQSPMHYQYF